MNRGDQASVHERFRSLRSGEVVGRPLVTAWLHLGTAHLPPDLVADLHLRFQRAFGWDIVKVMHDYRYALPVGLDDAPGRDFFAAVAEAGEPHGLAGQRDVLRHLLAARDRAVPVVETVFSPFQTLIRSAGSRVVPLLKEHPEEAAGALEVICDRMVDHVRTCLDMGVDGIFLSVNGAAGSENGWGLTDEQFEQLVAPFDRRVLDAAAGGVRVCHVHGHALMMERLTGYNYDVLSWSSHTSDPECEQVWPTYGVVPMTGLDEVACLYHTPAQVAAEVDRVWRATAGRVVVAPGCTPHTDTPPSVFRALRHAVDAIVV